MPEWISVKERLPEPGERVLTAFDNFVAEAFVNYSGVWMRNGFELDWCPPTHWMPLPEPPKEGGENEWGN